MIDNSGTLTPKWRRVIDRGTEQVWKYGELAAGSWQRWRGGRGAGDRSGCL
jgi:hypothetical protein